ncbi:MAG: threonylcarbamoyl-AMP synthase [Muribaculaceae bacterium]|nr:threonylcarbamoyl-AMP synthase [Muribaculaceae bacterium]MDE7369869.1 threonylcarbamoyl-AMP synthase [Muribaculaceae bacterium]
MRTLKMFPTSINSEYLDIAVNALRDGEPIIYPTDTLYAIGCDALNNRAIENICRIKSIDPRRHFLSVVCADISQAAIYARIDNRTFAILKRYLPGPYTFILPAATTLPKVFKSRRQVGIRIPDDNIATALASALGNPLLSSTADWADSDDDVLFPEAVADHFKDSGINLIIDKGECQSTLPSTIVDLTDSTSPIIIREGKGDFEI